METKYFLLLGIAVALVIAILAPFLASGNPDGLESAFFGIYGAKEIHGEELDEEKAGNAEEAVIETTGNTFTFDSPFADYSIPGLEKPGEVIAIVLGTIVVLGVGLGLGRVMARTK
jgi:cobalt/nickel transport protein